MGSTQTGLQYLLTKSLLQASKALNLSLYLLLKADQVSSKSNSAPALENSDNSFLMDDNTDNIQSHPVMDRLNQLSQLTDKLKKNVEEKTPGLEQQIHSLVKAAALMKGESVESSDESSDDHESNAEEDVTSTMSDLVTKVQQVSDEHSSASSSDDEEEESAIQRRVLTEAKFALRKQDLDTTNSKSSKKSSLTSLSSIDYGDNAEEVSDKALEAGRKLASTMNLISQKSSSGQGKKNELVGVEEEDDEYEQLQRGLSMMNEEFGMGSNDEDEASDEVDEEGFGDDDVDDFYSKIKSKSKAKKEAKRQMYAVAPKYPRLEDEVEGKCRCYFIFYIF